MGSHGRKRLKTFENHEKNGFHPLQPFECICKHAFAGPNTQHLNSYCVAMVHNYSFKCMSKDDKHAIS